MSFIWSVVKVGPLATGVLGMAAEHAVATALFAPSPA
jgi:hypothetical protein